MINIDTKQIKSAVYNLCIKANTLYDNTLYKMIYKKYKETKNVDLQTKYANILKNAQIAAKSQRPLCQDTGQVLVFVSIGQNVHICGENIDKAINDAVKKAYKKNFYRKSVVKNAIFDRTNTQTNTPAIIYYDFTTGSKIDISVMVKGAGSENYSQIKMFAPSATKQDIFQFVKETVETAGEKSCPPLVLGIGIGGTMDKAALMSKKAFFKQRRTQSEKEFLKELNEYLKENKEDILDIKLQTAATHIACLPVAVTINCHSTRHASCTITEDKVIYKNNAIKKVISPKNKTVKAKQVNTNEIEKIKSLKAGENILLSGEILTARDAAHKKIEEYYQKNEAFPFEIKNKIIFYAGPCPAAPKEIIGPIGPTTSARMDKYCELLYSKGLLATIGKGERSKAASISIKNNGGKYFTAQGGIASLLSKCVKKAELLAFEDLGPESVQKLYIENLPLKVEL